VLGELSYRAGSPHRRPAEEADETAKSLLDARTNQEFWIHTEFLGKSGSLEP